MVSHHDFAVPKGLHGFQPFSTLLRNVSPRKNNANIVIVYLKMGIPNPNCSMYGIIIPTFTIKKLTIHV